MAETPPALEIHQVCEIFPMMSPEQFVGLRADIEEHGQRDPIWLWEGKVIDGRNRLKACQQLGMEPMVREWDGEGSLVSFVVSLNLHRRHLDSSQRAMIGSKIKEQFEAEAKHNMSLGGKGLANLPNLHSRDQAAEAVNVSSRLIESATRVRKEGTSELAGMVEEGLVTVSAAAEIAELPKEDQAEIVLSGPKVVREKAAELRNEKAAARLDRNTSSPELTAPYPCFEGEAGEQTATQPDPDSRIEYLEGEQPELWTEEPTTEEESEAHSAEWEARWFKFLGNLSTFLVSVPRRGGVSHLTRNWSRKRVDAVIVRLEDLVKMANKCASELRESRSCPARISASGKRRSRSTS